MPSTKKQYAQARYWLLTIPKDAYNPPQQLDRTTGINFLAGQLERGNNTGYDHWQLICYFAKKVRLGTVKSIFGNRCHAEPSRSSTVEEYVWKDETSIPGTRFSLGAKMVKRNSSRDWESIRKSAKSGQLDTIPADVFVQHYGNLRRINQDHLQAPAIQRQVSVFWGTTGLGKSRRAWHEATFEAYPKDPRSKFWDGYRGQQHVVIDEFRGDIDIAHLLRWFDRYPVIVEVKGSSVVLSAQKIWITSNLSPDNWYPNVDQATVDALFRRLNIVEFTEEWLPPVIEEIPENNDEQQ